MLMIMMMCGGHKLNKYVHPIEELLQHVEHI